MQFYVKKLDGRTMTFEMERTATVLDLKRQIKARYGMAMSFQRLIYGSRPLGDSNTLAEAGLSRDCTVSLCGRLASPKIFLELPSGDDECFEWKGRLATLKRDIAAKYYLSLESIRLSHNGLHLECDEDIDNLFTRRTLGVSIVLKTKKPNECLVCCAPVLQKVALIPCGHTKVLKTQPLDLSVLSSSAQSLSNLPKPVS